MEPHWRAALIHAGLSYVEVYVAWMEVCYQLLTCPLEALAGPEARLYELNPVDPQLESAWS
jgi:hypothetical protein